MSRSQRDLRRQRPRRMPNGMDHRAVHTVMAWRSIPLRPTAVPMNAVDQAVSRRHGATAHVLVPLQLALLPVDLTHIGAQGMDAGVIRYTNDATGSGRDEGCWSSDEGGSDRVVIARIPSDSLRSTWVEPGHARRLGRMESQTAGLFSPSCARPARCLLKRVGFQHGRVVLPCWNRSVL